MIFTSDNAVTAAPEIMQALNDCNAGSTGGYGSDPFTKRAADQVREILEAPEAAVYFAATGTAANSIALGTIAQPWDSIFCHTHAHINEDECGAPEFYTNGAKLTAVGGSHGKIDPSQLRAAIDATGTLGVHNTQRGPLSITNLTENGSAYSVEETTDLCNIAREFKMPVHLDGARFGNAIVGRNASPADYSWRAGVDILVLGGTKNGLMFGEAVVIFDPKLIWEFELRRKRGGHLLSKGRYLGAQFSTYLENDNWMRYAAHANTQMLQLVAGLSQSPDVTIDHDVDGNVLFAEFPRAIHRELFAAGADYYLMPATASVDGNDAEMLRARLVTSWSTTDEDVARFLTFF